MEHRHLNHQRYTLAAIDDIIQRGKMEDWVKLRNAALADPALMDKIEQVCHPHVPSNPYAQRHHFWMNYIQVRRASPIKIHIKDYPQLTLIAWNRRECGWIEEREALALYERNWRFVDQGTLTDGERDLIDRLVQQYGNGVLNV